MAYFAKYARVVIPPKITPYILEILLDKTSVNEGLIKIKLNPADFQPRVEKKVKSYAKQANIKGFRPGKAPLGLVKKMYGKGIIATEVQDLLAESFENYIAENKIRLIGEPIALEKKAEDIDWTGQSDLEFEYEIGFATEFSCDLSADIEVTKYRVKAPDDERVEKEIASIREEHGHTEFPEVSQEGDLLYCTIAQKDGDISKEIILLWDNISESHQEKFIGLKPDDSLELNIEEVIDDADYLARLLDTDSDTPLPKEGVFTFTIKKIQRIIPAELNQELYDKEFEDGEVTNEEELKEKLRNDIPSYHENEIELLFNENIKDALIEHARISLPYGFLRKRMLKNYKETHTDTEQSDEDIMDKMERDFNEDHDHGARKVKWSFITVKIMNEYNIEITSEELKQGVKEYLISSIRFPYIDEKIDQLIDLHATKILQENKGTLLTSIYAEVLSTKVVELAKTKVTIKEEEVEGKDIDEMMHEFYN